MKYNFRAFRFYFVMLLMGTMMLLFQNCKQKVKTNYNLYTSDSSKMVVDESFSPIVDEELYVFQALDNKVHPTVVYAPENNAVNYLLQDSARVAILSRDLTAEEYKVLAGRNLHPIVTRFAVDAVALIVNQQSTDTLITVSELKKMLNGENKLDKSIVFDNPNSGIVSYLKRLSGNNEFKQKNIYALKSNKEVIKYVSEHPAAIGITDFSWLNDPDKDYAAAVEKVKIVNVKDDLANNASRAYYSPSQTTLELNQYPLTRNLYIYNATGKYGLGMKFAGFIAGDRGQMIILKSGLLPSVIPGREIVIRKKIIQ